MIPPNIHVHAYKYTHIHIHDTAGVHYIHVHLWTCKHTLSCSSNTFTVYIVNNHANICHCLQIHTCNLHLLECTQTTSKHTCICMYSNSDQLRSVSLIPQPMCVFLFGYTVEPLLKDISEIRTPLY
jgi:L-lactate utilization protein LutC